MNDVITNVLYSEELAGISRNMLNNILGLMLKDPVAIIELIRNSKNIFSTVRDGIFIECLETYILNVNKYDPVKDKFLENNLNNFSVKLAEASANELSGYVGDELCLQEYSKRIVKLLDDCGTVQKARYLANLTRAFIKSEISKRTFFKLCQCVKMLTEEDLIFLRDNINSKILSGDDEFIDDYRALGLVYEVNGGFNYSHRAFKLLKFALKYEEMVIIPSEFPKRQTIDIATQEDIKEYLSLDLDV